MKNWPIRMHLIVLMQIHPHLVTYYIHVRSSDMEDSSSFPELSSHATEEEKNLSFKEKINLIDNEIRQLYEFCLKAGYTQPQIEECAQPLLAIQSREKRVKWFWRLCSFALFVGFVAFLFAYDPTYRQICIYGKFVTMKVNKMLFYIYTEVIFVVFATCKSPIMHLISPQPPPQFSISIVFIFS